MGRFQHNHALRCIARGPLAPGDIAGRRIGIRSYTQTTGIWVRGILQHEYGVDLNKVTWVCNDDGHLAEFVEPPNVERTPPGSNKVDQMLLDAELDAAILGADMPNEPRVAHLIPNPREAALAWHRKYGTVPVNHFVCVDKDLADQCRARIHFAVRRTLQRSQQGCIGPQEIPRSPHVDPFRRKTESIDVALRHQETDRVRDLEFAPGRFRGRVDEGEDVFVEHVDARENAVEDHPGDLCGDLDRLVVDL